MSKSENVPKNRIAKLRKERNLSQAQLAKGTGLTRQAISLYEIGKREPKLETWMKLASFFDVPVSYLQGISDIAGEGKAFEEWAELDNIKNNDYDKNYRAAVAKLLETYTSFPVDELSHKQVKLIYNLQNHFISVVSALIEFDSFKTIQSLDNLSNSFLKVINIYRLLFDEPEKFEKRIIPLLNSFLLQLEEVNKVNKSK